MIMAQNMMVIHPMVSKCNIMLWVTPCMSGVKIVAKQGGMVHNTVTVVKSFMRVHWQHSNDLVCQENYGL
jgi:hypothetical protein